MNKQEHQSRPIELFLIITLPFIGTAVAIALSYWLYSLDIATASRTY